MEKSTVIKWAAAAIARGIAWFLAGKLGMDAAQSSELGLGIAEALASLVVAGAAIYSSVKDRGNILNTPPQRQ